MFLEIKDLREIAAAMIQLYPAMFLNSRSGDVGGEGDLNIDLGLCFSTCIFLLGLAGYGDTGGGLNLNGLAQKMSYRVNIINLLLIICLPPGPTLVTRVFQLVICRTGKGLYMHLLLFYRC